MSTGRPVGRPKGGDSDSTREGLVRAALALFGPLGYDGVTLADICRLAGVTAPTLKHHFKDKPGIYLAAWAHVTQYLTGQYERAIRGHVDIRARLRAMLTASTRIVQQQSDMAQFAASNATELRRHAELRARADRESALRAFLERLVADAAAAGELRPGVQQRGLVEFIETILYGLTLAAGARGEVARFRRVVDVTLPLVDGSLFEPATRRRG